MQWLCVNTYLRWLAGLRPTGKAGRARDVPTYLVQRAEAGQSGPKRGEF